VWDVPDFYGLMDDMEKEITSILAQAGPLTGAQLLERTQMEVLSLWQACRREPSIRFESTGRRFLRLDRNVQGYARLSPSIRREFLTYMLIGLDTQVDAVKSQAESLRKQTHLISQTKCELAKEAVISAIAPLPAKEIILQKACFLIAGDVVYDMSHTVSRPEKSTGEMVQGSDLDIIVVVEDDLQPELTDGLDRAIHKRKHLLLVNDREEIDYLIKTISRVKEQLKFDIFSSMVACKILDEAQFLYGNPAVFDHVKRLVSEYGIPERLRALEKQAAIERESAEHQLLQPGVDTNRSDYLNLFYTHAEEDEIY
jgi:hypothetical protein